MDHLKRILATWLVVCLMLQATGCTSWKAVTGPVPTAVAQHPGRRMQVHLMDGWVMADSATADSDSLVAYQIEGVRTIPVSQVKLVEVRKGSVGRTIGLVLGIAVGVVAAAGVATASSGWMNLDGFRW